MERSDAEMREWVHFDEVLGRALIVKRNVRYEEDPSRSGDWMQ